MIYMSQQLVTLNLCIMFSLIKHAVIFISFFISIKGSPVGIQIEANYSKYFVKNLPAPRIVGGEDAPDGYAKHMAGLVLGDVFTWLTCGGSIITPKHILTAAHCVDTNVIWGELLPSFRAVVGTDYWNKTENEIKFSGFAIHPGWSWVTLKNDIAVLKTAREMEFNDRVGAIQLNFNRVEGRIRSFVTGWGTLELFGESPYRLQILRVDTIHSIECSVRLWWFALLDGNRTPDFDPALEICTLHSRGHGMCHGDSGSALVDQSTGAQLGIVSWGMPCAVGAPDFFARVSAFEGFVKQHADGYL